MRSSVRFIPSSSRKQENMLSNITFEVRQVKLTLDTIKKEQAKLNKASEDMMAAIKENAENIESKHKLVFAMFFFCGNRSCYACGCAEIMVAIDGNNSGGPTSSVACVILWRK